MKTHIINALVELKALYAKLDAFEEQGLDLLRLTEGVTGSLEALIIQWKFDLPDNADTNSLHDQLAAWLVRPHKEDPEVAAALFLDNW